MNKLIKIKISLKCILLACLFLFSTMVFAQVTVNVKNKPIREILKSIEKNSGYKFFYKENLADLDHVASLEVKDVNINDAMAVLLKNTNISYQENADKIITLAFLESNPGNNQVEPMSKSSKKLSGVVKDNGNEPLIGVSVMVKGTTTGTVTDVDGKFEINIPDNKSIIELSYIGYNKMEVSVGNQAFLSLIMKEDTKQLDEVVVVGYGVQKKVNVIGSIAQLSGEKLENRTVPLLSNALAGQMTGVTVIQRSGQPGSSPGDIKVRGVGTFSQADNAADALVLIDGVPGSINDVKPEDVESISVLKDAATAAIYGARAANGVILITTKVGKEGKVKISYNGYFGTTHPTAFPDFVNSWEYATMYNEAVGSQSFSGDAIQKYKDGLDPDHYPNSDFTKSTFSRNGFITGNDLSVTGGNASTSYYLTFGYMNQDGIVEKNNYSRYDFRLNLATQLASQLKLSTWISGTSAEINEPAIPGGKDVSRMSGIISNSVRYPSIYAGKLSNGDYGTGPEQNGTPVAWLASESFYNNPSFRATGRIKLDYHVFNDLLLSGIAGYNFLLNETKLFCSTMRLNDTRTMLPSFLEQEDQKTTYGTLQFLADYNKTIGKHDFGVLGGYSYESNIYRNLKGSRDKLPVNNLPYLDMGSADNQKSSGSGQDWAIQSVFGRAKYAYDQKYLFESTVRYDGSSRFPENHKYAVFPSVALGWRLSEEGFFKNNISFINNLKLKTSWGVLGNQNIGNYPYQNTYSLDAGYVFGNTINQGGKITSLKDPNLHWEQTRTADGGLEIGLFRQGKLDINVNYFYRKTTDILYKPSSVSDVVGIPVDYANTGELENKGWEFEISHHNKIGNVSYHLGGNLSIIENKVLSLGLGNITQKNGMVGNGSDLFVGYPMQMYYGYKADGMFIDQADISSWHNQTAVASAKPQPGDLRYVDISGEGKTKDGKVDPNYDRVYLGSRIPKYTFSFNLGAEYRNFDLSAQLYGVAGVKGRLDTYAGYALFAEGNIQRWQMDGRWNPANPQRYNEYPRMELIQQTGSMNTVVSDFWILDASYVRLKNVQLGYTIPKSILNKIRLVSVRLYTNIENPYCWNKYRKGWDPEINTGGDYYPILSTYTFGLNVRF